MVETKAQPLSELQPEEYNFDSKVIQRMELLVLSTLEWRMMPITPFAFIQYFIVKFSNESTPRHMMSRTLGFILAIMREINLMDHRPSVIAAAATLLALDQTCTREALECKMQSISCSRFFQIEKVFECYNLMQTLEKDSLKTLEPVNSQRLSPTQQMDVVDKSSAISKICTKRRRLKFKQYDEQKGSHYQK